MTTRSPGGHSAPATAGALLVAAIVGCAAAGFGIGTLVGFAVPVGLVGFFIGVVVGVGLVHARFREL
jgi:hypothetical protein